MGKWSWGGSWPNTGKRSPGVNSSKLEIFTYLPTLSSQWRSRWRSIVVN
ncbi:MAG: hypothetical protein QNL65_04100 [Opitutales bacterium]